MKRACKEINSNTYEQNHASSIRPLKINFVRIKKLLFLATLTMLFNSGSIKAQDEDDFQTMFHGGIHRISGFGGPIYNYSQINGNVALLSGGGGGVLLNDFFIGCFGMSNTTKIDYNNSDMSISYGGLWFGYSHHSRRAVHPAFFLQTGWGRIKSPSELNYNDHYTTNERIFVINPEIELEVNIVRFLRISAGINYRIVGGADGNSKNFPNLSGPGANIMFKFGWF